jgi:hypothetical protein
VARCGKVAKPSTPFPVGPAATAAAKSGPTALFSNWQEKTFPYDVLPGEVMERHVVTVLINHNWQPLHLWIRLATSYTATS